MSVEQAVWTVARAERRRPWVGRNDFLAVATFCLIFGLQIVLVMQFIGGPEAYGMVASEGMQLPASE